MVGCGEEVVVLEFEDVGRWSGRVGVGSPGILLATGIGEELKSC